MEEEIRRYMLDEGWIHGEGDPGWSVMSFLGTVDQKNRKGVAELLTC
jgi:hypothetical protein